MSIRSTISGSSVVVLEGSYKYNDTVDLRRTMECTVRDDTGAVVYQVGQRITLDDDVNGFTFSGFITDAKVSNITPNPNNLYDVQASDNTQLAARRYSFKDYDEEYAGDIATDLLASYLAQDGVIGQYAIRRDSTRADFGQGTLSNAVAANNVGDGNLELAPSGTDLTATNAGQLLTPYMALKLTGYCSSGYASASCLREIWTGSYTIVSGDYLQYWVWVTSDSPQIKAGVEVVCSDGTRFSTSALAGPDTEGFTPDITNDLSGFANNKWMWRSFGVSGALIGKTIVSIAVGFGGTSAGTYTAYFRSIQWGNGPFNTPTVKINAFSDPMNAPTINTLIGSNGYSNVNLIAIPTYGTHFTNALSLTNTGYYEYTHNLSAIGIVKSSQILVNINSSTIETNASIQPGCYLVSGSEIGNFNYLTSGGAIPDLIPGMQAAGVLHVGFNVTLGMHPEICPQLIGYTLQVRSSYAATKTDLTKILSTQSDMTTGTTLTNVTAASGNPSKLTISGTRLAFAIVNDYVGVTTAFNSGIGIVRQQLQMTATNGFDARLRLDNASTWQNFIMECDVQVDTAATSKVGLIYRTTNWGTGNNTFAYSAYINQTTVGLEKGTNSTSSTNATATSIATVSVSLTSGSTHRLKVIVSGNNHQVWLDDVRLISATDSTYTAAGYTGLRFLNNGGAPAVVYFMNFGIATSLTGTWTSSSISLSSVVVYGTSYINWDTTAIPQNCSVTVQTSVDGGTTYTTVSPGGAIPGLTAGQSLSGVSLLVKATLATQNASNTPTFDALEIMVSAAYSTSGTRISPALPLAPVGIAGATRCSWNGLQPTNTVLSIATSIDNGLSWQTIGSGASGSGTIPGITAQPDPIDDTFDTNTSSLYTQTHLNSDATWTWNTANSRLTASGGNNALLEYNGLSFSNGDVMADLDQADNAGIITRVSGSTMYALFLYDSQATTFSIQNAFYLYAIVGGAFTQLASGSISFTRGTPHRFYLITNANTITATMDGQTLASITDTSITNPGTAGLLAGSLARFYQFRIQQYGQNVTSINALMKATIITTDPRVTAQLTDLTLSAHNPNIQIGAFVPKANYSVLSGSKNTVAADIDDLAKQSNFIWDIDKYLKFIFRARTANPAPWIATGADILISNPPQVENVADLFRDVQLVSGGYDVIAQTKTFTGDGETQTWTLDFPVNQLNSVTINSNAAYTIGVKGVDTGRDFYYQAGSPVISQDSSELPLVNTQSITFGYDAQTTVAVEMRDDTAIAARAALDSTTGVIQEVEDGSGLTKVAMIQKAQGLLQQYTPTGRTFTFLTKRAGLAAGQILTMFVPQFSVADGQFLITDVSIVWKTTMANGVELVQPFYSVTATSGPVVGNYVRWMSNIIQGGRA